MGDRTKIEYLDATWSPIKGCSDWKTDGHRTRGCINCWAERQAARFSKPGEIFEGLTADGRWSGVVRLYPHELIKPVHWTRKRRIGVSFMGDMFNPGARWQDQAAVFGAMLMASHHQFLLLTKNPQGMKSFIDVFDRSSLRVSLEQILIDPELLPAQLCVELAKRKTAEPCFDPRKLWDTTFPPKNVWAGVSVENQRMADKRINTLAEVRGFAGKIWVSVEPMLGPISLGSWLRYIDFVVVGGESGRGYRPMNLEWARALRDECQAHEVPFFFKQTAGKGAIPDDLLVRELPAGLNITTPNTKAQNHGKHQREGRA